MKTEKLFWALVFAIVVFITSGFLLECESIWIKEKAESPIENAIESIENQKVFIDSIHAKRPKNWLF